MSSTLAALTWGVVRTRGSRFYYHVSRLAKIDGQWFEIYWLPYDTAPKARGANQKNVRAAAKKADLDLAMGFFETDHLTANSMVWVP